MTPTTASRSTPRSYPRNTTECDDSRAWNSLRNESACDAVTRLSTAPGWRETTSFVSPPIGRDDSKKEVDDDFDAIGSSRRKEACITRAWSPAKTAVFGTAAAAIEEDEQQALLPSPAPGRRSKLFRRASFLPLDGSSDVEDVEGGDKTDPHVSNHSSFADSIFGDEPSADNISQGKGHDQSGKGADMATIPKRRDAVVPGEAPRSIGRGFEKEKTLSRAKDARKDRRCGKVQKSEEEGGDGASESDKGTYRTKQRSTAMSGECSLLHFRRRTPVNVP